MRQLILLVIILGITSCSSISVKRKSTLAFETLFIAEVIGKRQIILEANESLSGRALVGLLSGGVIGAVAAANVEDGFSNPKAFSYTLAINEQETHEIVSYSVVDIGACVEVISPDDSSIEILRVVPSKNCSKD
jgi:hypothetical protein|tara:strand:+ start:397 stop:798 length:402 start_codon:yes stop_codon:yes gene_type:complete